MASAAATSTSATRALTPNGLLDDSRSFAAIDGAPNLKPRPVARSTAASTRSLIDRKTAGRGRPGASTTMDSSLADSTISTRPAVHLEPSHEKQTTAAKPQQSPAITSAQPIDTSEMDDINLSDPAQTTTGDAMTIVPPLSAEEPPQSPERSSRSSSTARTLSPSKPSSLTPLPQIDRPGPLPSVTKGFKSPFSWLSRGTSEKKSPISPGHMTPRRNTAASAELLVGQFKDGREDDSTRETRESLRDRFKEARLAAETGHPGSASGLGINGAASAGTSPRSDGFGADTKSSKARDENAKEEDTPPMSQSPSTSGAGTSPPEVDWDLWQKVVYEGPAAVAKTSPEHLEAGIASGIPHPIRGVVWQVLAASKNEDLESLYEELVARGTDKEKTTTNGHLSLSSQSSKDKDSVASSASSIHSEHSTPATTAGALSPILSSNGDFDELAKSIMAAKVKSSKEEVARIQKLEKTIKRDLGSRTAYSRFEGAKDSEGLFGVCKAYALYDEAVGYAQGMNFLAQPLLLNMSRAEAFCLFVRLMSKYGMREMFIQDMPGLHKYLYQFERLLEDFEPAVYCHLNRRGVNANLYATQWFLTLFAYRFPLELVLRIYDLVLSEGLGAILKFGIVLMQRNRDALLEMKDMSQLCTFLKERIFDAYIDEQPSQKSILDAGFFGSGGSSDVYRVDIFVQDATSIKITPEMLSQYASEWEEKVRSERERELELESLRNTNAVLTQKVRRLEEHAEKADTEHVQAASELVRIQVENSQLHDENEALLVKVEELKNVVQHQTREVEDRMKAEVEAVTQANAVVHARNRELEEENEETTQALVQLKMEHASLSGEFEDLKRRWQGVREMLNGK